MRTPLELAEERGREESLLAILGTPFEVSPPFDFFDFLWSCWAWVEYIYLRDLRYGAPRLPEPTEDR